MSGAMKLVVDALPPSLNKLLRMHWATGRMAQRDWRLMIFEAYGRAYGPPILPYEMTPKVKKLVTLDFYFRTNRRRDADNYQKIILDALVQNGLLYDDSPEWCETRVRFWKDRDRPRTEITLEVDG